MSAVTQHRCRPARSESSLKNNAPILDISSPTSDVWHSVAFSLMLAMTFTWALSAIGFLFGASVGRLQATCGILLALFLLLRQHRGARARWLSLSCLIAVLAACLFISAVTVDITYDGWAYHQPGVIALSHGWNPVTEPGIPNSWAHPLSLVTALNPVCVVQSTTFYVDGSLGSCLAILIFSLLSYDVTRSGRDLVVALCAALLACNLKFTGPVYMALILLPFAAWWLFERRLVARDLLICGITASVLVAASINPYFTNLRNFGSPVYPLNERDVMEDQMSAGFLKENTLKKLLISLTFSNLADRPSDNLAADERNFTSPFQSRGFEEFKKFGGTADLRIGGFGPFFGITIALALLAASLLIRGPRSGIGFLLIALGTLLSVVVNPQMWWARYVPQLWLLPVLVATAASRSRITKALALIIVLLMGITSLIAVIGRATSSYVVTLAYKDNLKRIGNAPLLVDTSVSELNFLLTLTYRLHEQGTTFEVAMGQCATPIDLLAIQGCKNDSRGR